MNRYQDENWQQEEQRRREAYYRMNSQNSNTGCTGTNLQGTVKLDESADDRDQCGDFYYHGVFGEYRGYRIYVAVGCRLQTVHSEWRVVSAVYFYVSAFWDLSSCK